MIRYLFLFLASVVLTFGQISWNAPSTANANASYYVGASATYSDSYELVIYKNGYYFADGVTSCGAYTSDSTPQTVPYEAYGFDYWDSNYYSSRSVTIVAANNPPTVSLSFSSPVQVLSTVNVTGTASDPDADLRDYGIRWQGFGLQASELGLPLGTSSHSTTVGLQPLTTATMMVRGEAFDHQGNGYTGPWIPITVTPIPTTFTFSSLSHTYNGSTKTATVSANPSGATYTADLTKGPNAGSYTVTANTTAGGNYSGSGSATLVINPATPPSVSISPTSGSVTAGGSVTFNASGGLNGYTWGGSASGSGSSKTVTFPSAGNYTVTVQSPAGGNYTASNTATASITVSQQANVAPTTSISSNASAVSYGGSVTISFSCADANANLTQWRFRKSDDTSASWSSLSGSPSGASSSFSTPTTLAVGSHTYLVEAQDSGGLTSSSPVTVTVTPAPITAVTFANRTYTGSSQTTAVGSITPAGATYTTGGTTSATAAGTYSANVTGTGNFSGTASSSWTMAKASQTITFSNPGTQAVGTPLALSATASSGLPVSFTVTSGPATVSGATATFTGAGSVTITASQAGDANRNAAANVSQTFSVSAAPPPTISQQPQSQTAATGTTVTFAVTPAGTGPFTYQWKKNGTALAGQTAATLTLTNVQTTDAAGYTVQVTNASGTTLSNVAWLPIVDANGGGNTSSPSAAQKSPVAPGLVSTMVGGSGYDIATGSIHRVVRDFQVAGSVGAYPLEMTRTFTGSFWGYSFVWYAEELANPQFIQNQGFPPLAQQFLNVRTPDGQFLNFVANPTDYPTQFCQSLEGVRVAVVRESNQRIAAVALHFADGGYLMMEKAVDTGDRRKFRPVLLVDPFGLKTTYTYSGANSLLPYEVTDATGRYLRFTGTSETDIQRVESSDNKWIQWSGSTLSYWDGPTASFTSGTTGTGHRYYRFSDVRQTSQMRNVEYILEKVNYGPSAEPLPTNTYLWEVVRERHFTPTDAVDAGSLVSTRTVHERKQVFEEQGISATGPAVDVSEVRGDGATRNFRFQMSGGKMLSATDYRNNRSYFENWIANLPGTIRDARNNETNLESSGWGQISKITHPLTEVAPFLESGESAQTVRDYSEYQWTGRFLTGQRDERGNWTYYDRDAQNRIWRIRYADSSYEQFYYNSLNQLEKRRLRNGAFEYWDYYTDTKLPYRYWPANEANPGNVTSQPYFEYSYYSSGPQKGLLYTSRDPRGKVTTYEYFASGRLQKETFHDGNFRSYTYDDWGNRLTATDELGKTTTWTYDAYNRVQTVKDPTNDTTTHDYTPSRNDALSPLVHVASVVRRTTQPSLRKTAYKHDDDYHITQEIRGEGTAEEAKSFMEFDAVGNLSRRTDQVKLAGTMQTRVTDFAYDARNRKRTEFAPLSRTTKWKYDAASNPTKVIHPDTTFTTQTYNAMNQVATSADEMGDTTQYQYHASGLVWKIIDPRLKEYVHTYDAVGRLKTRTYPDSPATQEKWDYDAAGNVEFYYNRSNQKQTYTYDDRNRELTRTWESGVAPTVSTTYYANGLVWTRANGVSTLTHTYHDDGALHTQQQAIAGGPSNTITLTYDADGRRQTFNGGTGRDLGYLYNLRGGLQDVRNGGLSGTNLASFTYNLAEQRLTRTAGNSIATDYDYDSAGRLNMLNAAGVLRLDFGHDLRDRRSWTLRNQDQGDTYEYFNDSELFRFRHSVTRPDQNFNAAAQRTDTFDFDAAGNRLEFNRGGTLTTYTPGDDNRYTADSGATIAHDARGNVTTWDGKTFTYDADNRLRTVTGSGLTMTMDYDGDGRLVKLVKNGVAEYRFYDGAQCYLRTDANGTALDWTVWGPTPDEVIARHVSGAWQYYHQDPINSVVAVTSAGGAVLERYLYDPFGLPDVRNAGWTALGTASAIGNPWLFTGQEWRADLGLSNYKARWYQPTLGRFMQNDPVRFDAGDINLYRYCINDPTNHTDPSGKIVLVDDVIIAAGFGLVTGVAYITTSPEGQAALENTGTAIKQTAKELKNAFEEFIEDPHGLKNRDRKTDRRNEQNPLKNRERRNKERNAKPDDPEEGERVKNENHEIKNSRGQGGRGDAKKTDEQLENEMPPPKKKPESASPKPPEKK